MGSFDLWAWQFLWIVGLWFGVRWAQDRMPLEIWAKRVVIPAAMLVCAFFVLRREISHGFELGAAEFLFDKWHLGFMRLANFAAAATVLVYFQSVLRPLAVKPLVLMGQSSLQVFCVHLLFCFAGLTLLGNASMLSGWKQLGLLVATFSAMLLTAKLFSKSEAKQEPQPQSSVSLEPGQPATPAASARSAAA
jgi:hypothetical protein